MEMASYSLCFLFVWMLLLTCLWDSSCGCEWFSRIVVCSVMCVYHSSLIHQMQVHTEVVFSVLLLWGVLWTSYYMPSVEHIQHFCRVDTQGWNCCIFSALVHTTKVLTKVAISLFTPTSSVGMRIPVAPHFSQWWVSIWRNQLYCGFHLHFPNDQGSSLPFCIYWLFGNLLGNLCSSPFLFLKNWDMWPFYWFVSYLYSGYKSFVGICIADVSSHFVACLFTRTRIFCPMVSFNEKVVNFTKVYFICCCFCG